MIRSTLRVPTPPGDHLQEGQDEGLLAPLKAAEKVRRKLTVAHPGYGQFKGAYPGFQLAGAVAVSVPLAPLGPLIGLGLNLLCHLSFEDLVHHALYEKSQTVISLKKSSHDIFVYGNLELGHLDPSGLVCVSNSPIPEGRVALLLLRAWTLFTPCYRTLLMSCPMA